MPMQSEDDVNEKMMAKHRLPGTPDTLQGKDNTSIVEQPHSVANAADMAADAHGGVQYSSGTPTMKPAGRMPTSSPQGAKSSGGGSGRTGMPPTAGGKFNTGGRSGGGAGSGFGSANVTRGRGSSRR